MKSRACWCGLIVLALGFSSCSPEESSREQMVNLEVVQNDDPGKQLVSLNKAIERSKKDGSLFARRAMVLLHKGELEAALEDVNLAISLSKHDPSNYFVKAQVLYLMGRHEEALPLALRAERNSFQSASLYVLLSELYLQKRNYAQARRYVRQALELSPENEFAFYYNGRILSEMGDTARAVYNYKQALAQRPDFMEPHRELAGLYLSRRDMILAEQHLQKVGRLAPQDPLRWYYQGLLQLDAQRKDSAQLSFSKALSLADTLQGAHFQMGLLEHGQGNYEAALQHLEQAKKTYGIRLKYLSVTASAYERLGENLAALRTYERMVAIEPKHTYAQQSIARLKYRLERPRPQLDSMAVRRSGF
ncbi:tetratricopeptide repeat protein [Pontibacter sp. JH31]|uniref:Tetratricopeptide repeat protein n=1 Tax=Pontibacter aquaedesilientis TaxID=2766980 RepID=A0ABR7XF50_9BACT|nr:tetratricopeptide repeat protein [Pontibacter aquaedesilientis]MBD1396011.1 tetratricopeptide repeat protein [Pontibacter aquaedesilientis]